MKILVIDDEQPTLSMFRLFLSAYGHDVLLAENGEAGIEVFKAEKPGIVFTDLRMPGMDGLEVLRRIREYDLKTQVIVVTGHGDINMAMDALDLDVSDFINKPLEKKALDSALKRAETRIEFTSGWQFNFRKEVVNKSMYIAIMGKLSEASDKALKELLTDEAFGTVRRLSIQFDETFAINRQGIYSLINFIAKINNMGVEVSIRGLSYNYVRFFQMAGLHRIANIQETDMDEL